MDGLRGAELLAAVFADQYHGERLPTDTEPPSRGVRVGGVSDAIQHEQVPVLEGRSVALQEAALLAVQFVLGGWDEEQEEAVLAAQGFGGQDCSRARSAVSWAALA